MDKKIKITKNMNENEMNFLPGLYKNQSFMK